MQWMFRLYELLATVLPALIVFLLLRRYAHKNELVYPLKKLSMILLFALYVFMVFDVTGAGTIYEIGKYPELIRWEEISLVPFASGGALTHVLNIIMLMPLGILVPLIWPQARSLKAVLGCGFLFSVLIECSQLLNRRNSAVDDLLMNTLGAVMGYLLYLLFARIFSKRLGPGTQAIRAEHLVYLGTMFLGHFLLFDWRMLVRLFYDG